MDFCCPTAQLPCPSERALWHFRTIDLVAYPNSLPNRVNQTPKGGNFICQLPPPPWLPYFELGSKLLPWRWLHLICNANATGATATTTATCWSLGRAAWHFIICMRSVFVVCKSQVIGVKQLPGTWPLRPVTECALNLTETKSQFQSQSLWSCNNIYYLKAAHQNRTATTEGGSKGGDKNICHVARSLKQLSVLASSSSRSNPNNSSSCS